MRLSSTLRSFAARPGHMSGLGAGWGGTARHGVWRGRAHSLGLRL